MIEHETKAVLGWGCYLEIGDRVGGGDPDTDEFNHVYELVAFDNPEESAEDIDVSHFESPKKAIEKLRGMIDAGEGSFSVNYNPAQYPEHVLLVQLKKTGEKRNMRFFLPDDMEQLDWIGYVKTFKRNVDPKGAITADVGVAVAGALSSSLEEEAT
jgi:hypothetical protein